jgi:hypothetical protein
MSKIRTPFKKNKLTESVKKNTKEIVYFESIPEPDFDMTYHKVTLELIKYLTNFTRKTPEFRNFMMFVKTFLNVDSCSFYNDYSMKNGFTIELHHYPFSLFDICEAVTAKRIKENSYIQSFFVMEEIVMIHYRFLVGLTPLNPTAHDLAHNNKIKIYPKMIVGDWKELYNEYFPYLSHTAIKKYDELIKLEKEQDFQTFPDILKLNPQKIVVNGISSKIDDDTVNFLMIDKKIKEVDKLILKEGSA